MNFADWMERVKNHMRLGNLLQVLKQPRFSGDEGLDISEVAYHTSEVKPGSCFVAIRGLKEDGHRYVEQAIARGATAVVVEKDVPVPQGVAKIVVEDSRDALARLSAQLFGEPTKQLRLVGITGTNGKTTTAGLIEAVWKQAGFKTAVLSTVSYRWDGFEKEAQRTTPEASDLQRMFKDMVKDGVGDCVMEVTSHAVDLKRVVGCHFDGAVFTNLSEDHLDYHKDMESYFNCKARLFRERLVVSEKNRLWAVVNWDDPYGKALCKGLPAKLWRFSAKEKTEIHLKQVRSHWKGLQMEVSTPLGDVALSSPLIGQFNAMNILAAVGTGLAMQIPLEQIAAGVAAFTGVAGRLEKIPNTMGFEVFVDYAHTPAALEGTLSALKHLNPKRIITLFGCGGNRDRLKRPLMGEAAERFSDTVIVTSDNPRDEDPEAIIGEILRGFRGGPEFYKITDRRDAIAKALDMARPGDCVLIAGKGHEAYQEAGGKKIFFDDRTVVREILNGI